jgi:hypothetical protein
LSFEFIDDPAKWGDDMNNVRKLVRIFIDTQREFSRGNTCGKEIINPFNEEGNMKDGFDNVKGSICGNPKSPCCRWQTKRVEMVNENTCIGVNGKKDLVGTQDSHLTVGCCKIQLSCLSPRRSRGNLGIRENVG